MPKLIFKKNALLELGQHKNAHQLSMRSGVSYSAVSKYVKNPETVDVIDSAVLAALLLQGLGLSEKEALNLRMGDLFEFTWDGK
jgi:hypothetical protein